MPKQTKIGPIEKKVPLPAARSRHEAKSIWGKMKVGDSVLTPPETAGGLRGSAYNFGKMKGWKFTCRKTAEGFRIWRIA